MSRKGKRIAAKLKRLSKSGMPKSRTTGVSGHNSTDQRRITKILMNKTSELTPEETRFLGNLYGKGPIRSPEYRERFEAIAERVSKRKENVCATRKQQD